MHKDFHLYGTYLAARLAGKDRDAARKIACAAQAVDDFTYGEYGSCQELKDVMKTDMSRLKYYWTIFHFLPGHIAENITIERKLTTAPQGILYGALCDMIREETAKGDDESLTVGGAAAHVIADTYAHQNFLGVPSSYNRNDGLWVYGVRHLNFLSLLRGFWYVPDIAAGLDPTKKSIIGHGTAGNLPDLSWVKFGYTVPDDSMSVVRNNPAIFAKAFVRLYELFRGNIPPAEENDEKQFREQLERNVKTILEGRLDVMYRQAYPGETLDHNNKEQMEKALKTKNILADKSDTSFLEMLMSDSLGVPGMTSGRGEAADLEAAYATYLDYVNRQSAEYTETVKKVKKLEKKKNDRKKAHEYAAAVEEMKAAFAALSEDKFFIAAAEVRAKVFETIRANDAAVGSYLDQ